MCKVGSFEIFDKQFRLEKDIENKFLLISFKPIALHTESIQNEKFTKNKFSIRFTQFCLKI